MNPWKKSVMTKSSSRIKQFICLWRLCKKLLTDKRRWIVIFITWLKLRRILFLYAFCISSILTYFNCNELLGPLKNLWRLFQLHLLKIFATTLLVRKIICEDVMWTLIVLPPPSLKSFEAYKWTNFYKCFNSWMNSLLRFNTIWSWLTESFTRNSHLHQ